MLQIFAPAEGMISGFSKKAKLNMPPHVQILADSGYQGTADIHSNSIIPEKKKQR
jgi:hypothetical protein